MKTKEQELFELVSQKGEALEGKLHIIDMTEDLQIDYNHERWFRVYHADGYCFDISSKYAYDELETEFLDENPDELEYVLFSDFDGFKKIDAEKALELVKEMKS